MARAYGEMTGQQGAVLSAMAEGGALVRVLPAGGWRLGDRPASGRTAHSLLEMGWITPVPETAGTKAVHYQLTSAGARVLARIVPAAVRLTVMQCEILAWLAKGDALYRTLGGWYQNHQTVSGKVCHNLLERGLIKIRRAGETMERSPYDITDAGLAALEGTA